MIFLYVAAAILAGIVYLMMSRSNRRARVIAALFVFLLFAVLATAWVAMIGDPAPAGAVTVSPSGGLSGTNIR